MPSLWALVASNEQIFKAASMIVHRTLFWQGEASSECEPGPKTAGRGGAIGCALLNGATLPGILKLLVVYPCQCKIGYSFDDVDDKG